MNKGDINEIALDNPLVSIVVITYNSAQYVIETLQSAYDQSYENIELLVSDDGSVDNTIAICTKWIENHKDRFVNVQVITTSQNTGISANCNRGVKAANGEWVKLIAGDDMLVESAISRYVKYILKTPESEVVVGKLLQNKNNKTSLCKVNNALLANPKDQYKLILKNAGILPLSVIFNRMLITDLGGFDEKYAMCEEIPLYLKLAEKGVPFHFIDEIVAVYRIHEDNLSGGIKRSNWFNFRFYRDAEAVLLNEFLPRMLKEGLVISVLDVLNVVCINRLIILFGNRNNVISKVLSMCIVTQLFQKFKRFYIKKYKKRLISTDH